VKDGLQYMQDGKVSPVYVSIRMGADRKPSGQRTEANISHFRHTCGLIARLSKARWESLESVCTVTEVSRNVQVYLNAIVSI
jgi:hypothetical protein